MKYVQIIPDDANKRIPDLEDGIGFVFLDARKEDYLNQLQLLEQKLSKNAVIVADNVSSHAEALEEYLKYVRMSGAYESTFVDIGQGVEVSKYKGQGTMDK